MGSGCHKTSSSSNFDFKYFFNKYGKQTMLEVVQDNIRKEQIIKKMPEIIQKYRKSIHNCKIDSVRQLNIVQARIYDEMEAKIKEIDKNQTGEIVKAENLYHECAQELMGRQEISQDFKQLRRKIHEVYEEEENNTKQKIQADFQSYVINLERQKNQKFIEIGQLSQEDRKMLKTQTRKKFKKQINLYKQQVQRQIQEGKVVSMVHLRQDYNHLHPKEEVQRLRIKAEELIRKGQQIIKGRQTLEVNSKEVDRNEVDIKKVDSKEIDSKEAGSKEILPFSGFWGCCCRG